jgi:hypothetical protein
MEMGEARTITVTIPDCYQVDTSDLTALGASLQNFVNVTCNCQSQAGSHVARMMENGWQVRWGLAWVAEARRGHLSEEATGATKEDALMKLRHLTRLHEVDGTP